MSLRCGALALPAAMVLLLGACASSFGTREGNAPSRPLPQPPVSTLPPSVPSQPSGEPFPNTPSPVPIEPTQPAPPSYPRTAEAISGQAVVSLMRQAASARSEGRLDLAAAQLERAQRIEPRNYFVWSALAKVYLDQAQYDQAVSVAGKSNSLARGNVYVEVENWKTIAAARRALGDSIGALQAEARLDEIQRSLGGG